MGAENVVESTSKEHFIQTVTEAVNGEAPHILIWGGDGTAHDAVNAVMAAAGSVGAGAGPKSIGFLRGGSGNGTQDSYGVPRNLKRQLEVYAEAAEANYVVHVDLLEVESGGHVKYGQLAGLGFDASVLERREAKRNKETGRVPPGMVRYVGSAFATFFATDFSHLDEYTLFLEHGKYAFRGPRVNAEFAFDDMQRTVRPVMIEIGTRPYYGRMFKICPDVVCNDGNIDVYVYNFATRMDVVKNVPWIWTGKHHRINRRHVRAGKGLIERFEIQSCRIARGEPFLYHVDGELFEAAQAPSGAYELRVRVRPSQIGFLVPGEFYRLFHPFDPTLDQPAAAAGTSQDHTSATTEQSR